MARSQGDSFRTWTDHSLNEYKWRLRAKVAKIIDHREKWFRVGDGWILYEERNRVTNPNGSWKWNGWEIEAHEYWVTVFPEECIKLVDGKPQAIGWSQMRVFVDDDREKANGLFKKAQKLAKTLKTWYPDNADSDKTFFEYEGRKPQGRIIIKWDGDTVDKMQYSFILCIDGENKMTASTHEECEEEAKKMGVELIETHTP